MTVSWFFLLEVRKYLIYFWLRRNSQFLILKETEFLNAWNFKDCGTFEIWNVYIDIHVDLRDEQEKGYAVTGIHLSCWQGVSCAGLFMLY